MHNRNAHQMWNNGQGWQAYGDLNLRTWYQSDLVTITDQAMTKHYFIAGQRIASKLAESLEPEVVQSLKDKPVTPLSGDIRDLGEGTAARIARDFDCVGIDYNAFYPGEVKLEALETLLNAPEQPAEYQVFFYHSDHLGSSSFITDVNGDATQHLQYLPFGEDLVHEQNTAAYLSPYTFSGKERDVETGLSYFGARYYESSLSIWLSVDPLSDKYPSLSAYNYCALNPVMLVDPDGREVESIDDPLKCHKWGKNLFQRIGDKIRDAFWFDTKNTTTYKSQPTEVFNQSRTDEPLDKPVNVVQGAEVSFETFKVEDQLIIKDKTGKEVVNSGSVATDGTPQKYQLKKGKYNLTVVPNTNPDQQKRGHNTRYEVAITSSSYTRNVRSVYRLWGVLPFWVSNSTVTRNSERHPMPEDLNPKSSFGPKNYIFR